MPKTETAAAAGYAGVRDLLRPSSELLERRFADQQAFTTAMLLLFAPFSAGLWTWDWVIDPAGAPAVLPYRLMMGLTAAIPAWATSSGRLSTAAKSWIIAVASCLIIAEFYVICSHLADGFTYGIGGFMFAQMCGFLLWTGLPFVGIALIQIVGAGIPHLLAWLLDESAFPHLKYAVLIWPATGLALAAHYAMYSEFMRRVQLSRRLVEMASIDSLTGALNRRTFMSEATDRVAACSSYDQPVSLMFIDADHFKSVNDRFGHAVGDAVLTRLGEIVRAQLRKNDLCCRWGGEEFVVLLCDSDEQTGTGVAQRMLSAIRRGTVPIENDSPLTFTASIGMVAASASATGLDALIRKADEAMYAAKKAGRDRLCVAGA